jgi:hypothetical protein
LGVEMVVVLGALLGDTPHTRPVPVTGVTSDPDLARTMNLEESRYEGPTGIVGILQEACTHAGVPAVSLWASVPHYVSQPPNPKATLALLNRLEDLLQLNVPLGELPEDARAWQLGVDQLAAEDSEVAEYVQSLEDARDTAELPEASGEAIAKEFERYLRRRDGGDSRESGTASRHATDTKPPETESAGEKAGDAKDGPEAEQNGQGKPQDDGGAESGAEAGEPAGPAKPRKAAKRSDAKSTAKKTSTKKTAAKKAPAKKATAKKATAKKPAAKKSAAKKTTAKKTGTGKSTKSTRSRKSAESAESPGPSESAGPSQNGTGSPNAEGSEGSESRKDDGTSEASKPRRTTRRKSAKPEKKPEDGGGEKPSDEK